MKSCKSGYWGKNRQWFQGLEGEKRPAKVLVGKNQPVWGRKTQKKRAGNLKNWQSTEVGGQKKVENMGKTWGGWVRVCFWGGCCGFWGGGLGGVFGGGFVWFNVLRPKKQSWGRYTARHHNTRKIKVSWPKSDHLIKKAKVEEPK